MKLKHTAIVLLVVAISAGCGADSSKKAARLGSTAAGSTTNPTTSGNVINGTPQADTLDGTSADETINGLDGDDVIRGMGGADTIDGGLGNDTASYEGSPAGVTVDLLTGSNSGGDATGDVLTNVENLTGSSNDDVLIGDDTDNVLDGAGGNDTITGNDGADTISGGDSGDDTIDGGFGDDIIEGGPGADTLDGGGDLDTVSYAASAGAVTVDLGASTAAGGDAQGDTIVNFENVRGSIADDTLTGADGVNNVIEGGPGRDAIDGGPNSANTVSYEHAASGVTIDMNLGIQGGTSDETGDLLINIWNVRGSAFDDTLTGIDSAGVLGIIEGGPGADVLAVSPNQGGIISYENSSAAVTVDLAANTASGGDAQGDDVSNLDIDGVIGTNFNDTLTGSDVWGSRLIGLDGDDTLTASNGQLQFANNLLGGEGNDVIVGGDQSVNQIDGGGGADTCTGGTTSDIMIYDPIDVSYDFVSNGGGIDLLVVDQDLDLANPGPTIQNMTDMGVPQQGGAQITVTITPASLVATTAAGQLMIDASPYTAASDAVIVGTGWTRNGTTNMFGIDYVRFEGAGGAVLLVNPLVSNTAGVVP